MTMADESLQLDRRNLDGNMFDTYDSSNKPLCFHYSKAWNIPNTHTFQVFFTL
jgi:hypothetical protein